MQKSVNKINVILVYYYVVKDGIFSKLQTNRSNNCSTVCNLSCNATVVLTNIRVPCMVRN